MKNKLIIIGLAIFLIFVTYLATYKGFSPAKDDDQHIVYKDVNKCNENDKDFCTHLPIVMIDTHNQKIPGKKRDNSTILTDISIVDNTEGGNHINDNLKLLSKANIRYRGNSSLNFDKKGILINLVNEDGSENDEKVLGMPKHHEWILHGPFLDKTLIRNYMWYHIAGKIMDSAPKSKFCELFIDGKYLGLYLMVESPSRGENSRMPVSKYKKGKEYTSYIVRVDRGEKDKSLNLNTYTSYTNVIGTYFDLIYPAREKTNPVIKSFIEKDISKFEKALYSYDYKSATHGYKKYINVDSFVNYYIINEFTINYDAGSLSTYLYKDLKGKYNLYVWDFNNANDNYQEQHFDSNVFDFQNDIWFSMLMRDKDFNKQIISRYRYLRKNYLSDEYLLKYIDDVVDYLGPAINRNFEVWGYSFNMEDGLLEPSTRNIHSYEEAINQLKNNILERGKFLDENIETIYQFSHPSVIKKYTH